MSDNPETVLLPKFQFLVDDLGFRVVASETSSSFDNMFVELTNHALNIRLARARGFVNAEVSPPFAPRRWVPVEHLQKMVLGRDPVEDLTLEEQADFVRCHYPVIVTMLAAENLDDTIKRVHDLGRDRLKKLFPGCVDE
jgi:hypothetical protein